MEQQLAKNWKRLSEYEQGVNRVKASKERWEHMERHVALIFENRKLKERLDHFLQMVREGKLS